MKCSCLSRRLLMFLLVLSSLLLDSVAAFQRRFGIYSAAVTTANNNRNNNDDDYCGKGSSWLVDDDDLVDNNDNAIQQHQDDHDEEEDNHDFSHALALHPLLQIPVTLSLSGVWQKSPAPIQTFVDTGAMRTVMSYDTARTLGVLQHLDRRYAGQASGIGSCRVLGRLPAGLLVLHLNNGQVTVNAPAITILEDSGLPGVELLLGLDFLREYQAILDLRVEEVRLLINGQEHAVPFVRPRLKRRDEYNDDNDDDDDDDDDDWNCRKIANIHHGDASRIYDKRYFEDEDSEDDDEDWPDMSGV